MNDQPITEASIIIAPPDDCGNCSRERVQPYTTSNTEAGRSVDEIRGFYRCPDCDLYWGTTWQIRPIP